jgi:hypothetical protein
MQIWLLILPFSYKSVEQPEIKWLQKIFLYKSCLVKNLILIIKHLEIFKFHLFKHLKIWKNRFFLHPKSRWRFWYGSAYASESVVRGTDPKIRRSESGSGSVPKCPGSGSASGSVPKFHGSGTLLFREQIWVKGEIWWSYTPPVYTIRNIFSIFL